MRTEEAVWDELTGDAEDHAYTLHFGTETYWGGVLPHSGKPGRAYRELARLGEEFERAGDLVAGITPDADITMVYSAPSKWLMRKHPPLAGADGGPDAYAYEGIFEPFYRGAFEAGRQVRILHARQLHDPSGERQDLAPEWAAERHPVLIAPGLYVADDGTLHLRRVGHAGHSPSCGYPPNRSTQQPMIARSHRTHRPATPRRPMNDGSLRARTCCNWTRKSGLCTGPLETAVADAHKRPPQKTQQTGEESDDDCQGHHDPRRPVDSPAARRSTALHR